MAAMSTLSAPQCQLLNLPPELRLPIYYFVFKGYPEVHLWIDPPMHVKQETNLCGPTPFVSALLGTCRIICTEARPVLFAVTAFDITIANSVPHPTLYPHTFGDNLALGLLRQVRQVKIHVSSLNEGRDCPGYQPVLDAIETTKRVVEVLGSSAPGPGLLVSYMGLHCEEGGEADAWLEVLMPLVLLCPPYRIYFRGTLSAERKEMWKSLRAERINRWLDTITLKESISMFLS